MHTRKIKGVYDLEYEILSDPENINNLKVLLASYQVYMHKLMVFQWNVVGPDYVSLRRKFRDLYEKAFKNVNEIAERIGILDQSPPILFEDIIRLSRIEENGLNLTGAEMVKVILEDILALLSIKRECLKTAIGPGDHGTEEMVKALIYEMEKDHHRLLALLK
jgi:starvation-inducible DNA-binding protein